LKEDSFQGLACREALSRIGRKGGLRTRNREGGFPLIQIPQWPLKKLEEIPTTELTEMALYKLYHNYYSLL